jgi:hypothetical protein
MRVDQEQKEKGAAAPFVFRSRNRDYWILAALRSWSA